MTGRSIAFCLTVILALLLWLFTGIEEIGHEDTNIYEFFAKQTPSFKIIFKNAAHCGECDLRPWRLMSQAERVSFAEYCAVRFGLDQLRPCYAIFAEKQRMADERLGVKRDESTP
ncbi:MAG: hypothetical protein LBV61_11140 [Burkholderiaceae bacterium]|jgi:hypothetical protein|nr:hypothetical protein [Burkholderiaceae bacterium]